MPESTPNTESIFWAAMAAESPEACAIYLDRVCGSDPKLRAQIEEMIAAYPKVGSFLESPGDARTIDAPAATETAGTVIGPYKLLQKLGEGGMGEVWMAEQAAPVHRRVAVKIIRPGMDSAQVVARFEAERQALALMDHPNIAKVFDAGTTDRGRPFFVMELVKGTPITRYCDEHKLTPKERLELFIPVCQAVQHAHQKGIIHRDLKPSNVLVAPYDGKPVVKVIDFGVAKAAGQRLTEKTLFTEFGAVVGTPEYMSPEQAELNNQDIDTRSDIYSLGILLYELLTGTTPLTKKRAKEAALLEVLRVIREEEAQRPSTRLSTTDELPSIAASRGVEPKKLSGLVRGELDWIVMKALEKDRGRRYETANGFAADVQRYLADEPVQACPPSAGYRLRKFARRNRLRLTLVGTAALALLVAVAGIAVAVGWAVRDREAVSQQVALDKATRRAALEGKIGAALDEVKARYETDDLPGALAAVARAEELMATGTDVGDELRQLVDAWRAELMVIEQLEEIHFDYMYIGPPVVDATYTRVFREIGIPVEELSVEEAGRRIRSRLTWRRLAELMDSWADLMLDLASQQKERRQRLIRVARAADDDPLRTRVRIISETWDRTAAEQLAATPDTERLSFEGLRQLTVVLYWAGGEAGRKTVLRLLERALTRQPGDFRLARSLGNRYARLEPPKWPEAAHYYSIALAIRPQSVYTHVSLAGAYRAQGKFDEATAVVRRAIRLNPPDARAHHFLGSALTELGDQLLDESIAEYRKAIRLDPKNASIRNDCGAALRAAGKPDEAIAEFREAIRLKPDEAIAHDNLGIALRDKGKLDEAIDEYREAIRLNKDFAHAHSNLARALRDKGKLDEAIDEYREAIRLKTDFALTHNNLGVALHDKGKLDEAAAEHREAIRLKPDYADAHSNLGTVLRDKGRPDESAQECREAIRLDSKNASAHNNLGNVLRDKGKLDEAIDEYREAIRLDPKLAGVHSNLGNALRDQRKLDEAIAECREAIALDPKLATAYSNLGLALQAKGHLDNAIAELRKAVALAPKNAGFRYELGLALGERGDLNNAVSEYRKILELDPAHAGALNNLAWILATAPDSKLRNPQQALTLAKKAVALAPNEGGNYNTFGAAYYSAGKWNEAIQALQKSMELCKGGDANDWFFLAMAHWQLGDKKEARKWYDRAVEWMEKNDRRNEELGRFRADAEKVLGVKKKD